MSSDYTPEEEEFIDTYVSAMSGGCTPIEDPERTAEARRGIAKMKADALREAAMRIQGRSVGSCNTGCHVSDMMTLQMLADRIEGEA